MELPKDISKPTSIEQSAHCQENESLLLFSRLHNPVIKKQLVDFVYSIENDPENGKEISREQIEADLDKRIEEVENATHIAFADSEVFPSSDYKRMVIGELNPFTGTTLTTKQMSMAEAHEKGHVVRDYDNENKEKYARRLSGGFDISKFELTESEVELSQKLYGIPDDKLEEMKKEMKDEYIKYLVDPKEIVERMSQLKNYFGFKADEEFTSQHLQYARDNYVKDIGIDNAMTAFFSIVTPETEPEFLRLINSVGI